MVQSIKEVLIERDGLSESEANEQVNDLQDEFMEIISKGGNPWDLMDGVGLEPDYLEELMF